MSATVLARFLLRSDALANAGMAIAVLGLAGPLARAAGLGAAWPLAGLAGVLLANGTLCWGATRGGGPAPRALRALAAIDVVFAVGLLGFALTDPAGAVAWLRLVLIILAAVITAVAATKLLLASRLQAPRAQRPVTS